MSEPTEQQKRAVVMQERIRLNRERVALKLSTETDEAKKALLRAKLSLLDSVTREVELEGLLATSRARRLHGTVFEVPSTDMKVEGS